MISYTSDQGKTYDFNTADKLNTLLINALVSTGELKEIEEYDVDFDHQLMLTLTISFLKRRSMMQNRPTKSSSATGLAYMLSVTR